MLGSPGLFVIGLLLFSSGFLHLTAWDNNRKNRENTLDTYQIANSLERHLPLLFDKAHLCPQSLFQEWEQGVLCDFTRPFPQNTSAVCIEAINLACELASLTSTNQNALDSFVFALDIMVYLSSILAFAAGITCLVVSCFICLTQVFPRFYKDRYERIPQSEILKPVPHTASSRLEVAEVAEVVDSI